MKILFIAPTFEGGIGGHALRVAEKLREVGFDVKLMSVPHIPIRKLKNPSFALVSSIRAIFSNEKFDVVHAFNVPSAFAMKYIKARKRVLSVHGIYSDQVDALHSRTIASLAKLAESIVLKWADRLATDSKIVQRVYKEKYGLDFEFLFAPLDIEKFNGIPDVQKKENKIIYIGRDSYEKGIDILRGIESKLNGHVTFCTNLSWRDAMIELKSSSILVVPSRMESIPQVIKEAFYLGIPVIATNVGGIPEIIVNGQNGILVPPQDPEKLTSAINDLLNNKEMANRLSHSGHEYVMKNLTWDALLPKYVKFYEDLFKN
ncbi:MAG: glycosyltransferase family 4 protein [Candidatus Nitrosotenuis sp.]